MTTHSATYFFRAVDFIKTYAVTYLTSLFYAQDKGVLVITDGTNKVLFDRKPKVIKAGPWTARDLPVVLVSHVGGDVASMAIGMDVVDSPTTGTTDTTTQYKEIGGDINTRLNFKLIATTGPERDRLVDVVGIYLAHPDAKTYFNQHGITLPSNPSVGGDMEEFSPRGIDYPIYSSTVSMDFIGTWRGRTAAGDSLIDVIADVAAYIDL